MQRKASSKTRAGTLALTCSYCMAHGAHTILGCLGTTPGCLLGVPLRSSRYPGRDPGETCPSLTKEKPTKNEASPRSVPLRTFWQPLLTCPSLTKEKTHEKTKPHLGQCPFSATKVCDHLHNTQRSRLALGPESFFCVNTYGGEISALE